MEQSQKLITVPSFERIPFLCHGFGTSAWKRADFKKVGPWRNFRILSLQQIHSDFVLFVDDIPAKGLPGDAIVTSQKRLLLIIKSADCLPVLLVDEEKRLIAAAHCGWRGTLLRILEKVVSGMKVRYGSSPRHLLAALGPAISSDCYEVGKEIRQRFIAEGFPESLFRDVPGQADKHFFHLRQACRLELRRHGVLETNIFSVDICTHCDPRFPSFRRDREKTSRMISFIGMMDTPALS